MTGFKVVKSETVSLTHDRVQGCQDTGDLISERSGYFESEVGSPSTTDAMKRTC